jgi:hypothetical protein
MTYKIIDDLKVLFESIEKKNELELIDDESKKTKRRYISNFKTEIQNRLIDNQTEENIEKIQTYILEVFNIILFKDEFASKLTIDKFNSKKYLFFNYLSTELMDVLIYKCFELGFDFKYLCLKQKLDLTKINLKLYNKYLQNLRIFDFEHTDNHMFPNVFSNNNSYELFLYFLEIIKSSKYPLADVSYYYRKMYDDKLIIKSCRGENFKTWLHQTYDIEIIHSLKRLGNCKTNAKELIYNSKKASYFISE